MFQQDFHGRTMLVTGGADGLGLATAARMAQRGAAVVIVDIDEDRLSKGAQKIKDLGGQVLPLVADVSDEDSVRSFVQLTADRFGRIDALFNNAGILGPRLPTIEYPTAEFDKVIAVNLRGVFLGMKYVLPIMVKQRAGVIVNTGSMASAGGIPSQIAYVAAKHAVIGMTKTAAGEVALAGVRVNAVLPGNIRTKMSVDGAKAAAGPNASEEDGAAQAASLVPQGRMGEPDEIAAAVCFLVSDESRHITGVELNVDGGILSGAYGCIQALVHSGTE